VILLEFRMLVVISTETLLYVGSPARAGSPSNAELTPLLVGGFESLCDGIAGSSMRLQNCTEERKEFSVVVVAALLGRLVRILGLVEVLMERTSRSIRMCSLLSSQ
jgi:hypothetical protein